MKWLARKPIDSKQIEQMLNKCAQTGQYVNGGEFSAKLEDSFRDLAKISDDREVIYLNSATSALHLALKVIKRLMPEKETVVTSAYTFPSVIQSQMYKYEVVDIDQEFQPVIKYGEKYINVVTNLLGYVTDLSKHRDEPIIYDNAATPIAFYDNRSIHDYGFCSVVSLHHTKLLGFGEGGFLILDKKFSDLARSLSNFGFTQSSRTYNAYGSNYKASELSAIYSLEFLSSYSSWKSTVDKNFDFLCNELGLNTLYDYSDKSVKSCFFYIHSVPISIKNSACKKYYEPLKRLKVSANLFDRCLCIPTHQDITQDDLFKLCKDHQII